MSIIKQLLTGVDGETHDIGRWGGVISFAVGLGLEIFAVVETKPFDFMAYGLGVAAMATGIGALLRLKKDTEPGAKP